MEWLQHIYPVLDELTPLIVTVVVVAAALAATRALTRRRERRGGVPSVTGQMVLLAMTLAGLVAIVVALPVSESLRGRLIGLVGIGLTGVIAFSSTTFVSNAMAGLMLRAVGNFRPGDWLRVGDQFGRVTERGLFHTEIQTEDRDLATLPNLYLVTQPVKVVRESGTIVSTVLSLAYDLDHSEVETLLIRASADAGLEDGFVRILSLDDFSVSYGVAGFLEEVNNLLTVRSRLNACVLDTLHAAGVEIVSPTFMNQRSQAQEVRVIPTTRGMRAAPADSTPEERIFDKADQKASLVALREERAKLGEEISALESTDDDDRHTQIAGRRQRIEALTRELDRREAAER